MSAAQPEEDGAFVLLGTVLKAHGIHGELKVRPFTRSPGSFSQYRQLYLTLDGRPPGEFNTPCTGLRSRVSGQAVILRLAECVSREQAEALSGAAVWLPVAELPPPEEGEFYLHSLQGKEARLAGQEKSLGRVCAILSTAGQDILVIRRGVEEFLVPAVRDFLVSMDETSLTLRLPPGLLEINCKTGGTDGEASGE